MPRLYCPVPLSEGADIDLPAGAARHVQVLRLQPGDAITLFNGQGGSFAATVTRMGRSEVAVRLGPHDGADEREAARAVHIAVAMPANERMDWLVEKATELGVASVQPLMSAHSVLRLKGERAEKKRAHWQAIAVAACEQCGRNRVPPVLPVLDLGDWLPRAAAAEGARWLLSLQPGAMVPQPGDTAGPLWFLSGPEGGLSAAEEAAALAAGFRPATLGPRILRAETAPLAVLARWC